MARGWFCEPCGDYHASEAVSVEAYAIPRESTEGVFEVTDTTDLVALSSCVVLRRVTVWRSPCGAFYAEHPAWSNDLVPCAVCGDLWDNAEDAAEFCEHKGGAA